MADLMLVVTVALLGLGALLMIAGLFRALFGKLFGLAFSLLFALLLIAAGGLLMGVAVATHGYRALTQEEVAARIHVQPLGPQNFIARFDLADGRQLSYQIAGEQLYVDAHILKWKSYANLLGLHTAYELDRVGGRYFRIEDERNKTRSLYSLKPDRVVDMFDLRQRYTWLGPVLDAEYGSGTFVPATHPASYELRVSTTGLMMRPVAAAPTPPL